MIDRKKEQRKPLAKEDQWPVRLFYLHREAFGCPSNGPIQQCRQWRPMLMSRLSLRQSSQGKHPTQLERTERKHWKKRSPPSNPSLPKTYPTESLA